MEGIPVSFSTRHRTITRESKRQSILDGFISIPMLITREKSWVERKIKHVTQSARGFIRGRFMSFHGE